MHNVIPFPQNPAEAREDLLNTEAAIWEMMRDDEYIAGAVAKFIVKLDPLFFVDMVQGIANDDMSAAYNAAYTIVSEATTEAAKDALEKGKLL